MDNNISRYKLVIEVAKRAQQMQEEDRNPIPEKKNSIYKEVNKTKQRRNYVLEAFEQITNEKADEEEC